MKLSADVIEPYDVEGNIDVVRAFRALAAGEARPEQQVKAMDALIHEIARTYDLSYRPESADKTAFSEGKRFVGLQVVRMINSKPRNEEDG